MDRIRSLLGDIEGVHIDIIRPPYSESSRFAEKLIEGLCQSLRGTPLELHLMAREPLSILENVKSSCMIEPVPVASVHIEAFTNGDDAVKALREIKLFGFKAGIALDLPTPVGALQPSVVREAELILVMSVLTGKGGQKFNSESIRKMRWLKETYPSKLLAIDGGINEKTARLSIEAGADRLIIGSRITKSEDPLAAIEGLRRGLNNF